MSQETKDDFCINCKVNLGAGQEHSEACKFLKQAELEKQKIQDKANKAIENAKEELEKKSKDETEKITKEVREKLEKEIEEEKKKKKELLKKKDDETKLKFIAKILQFTPNNEISFEQLEKKSLDELMKFYRKIIQITVADKKNNFEITCPKCLKPLGKTVTRDEAVELLKNHKNECPKFKNSNLGKWIVFGLVISMIAGSIAFVTSNKHILKKGKEDD